MTHFLPSAFFDISDFPYADIFSDDIPAWEVLPHIEAYVTNLFASGKIKANYKNRTDVFIGEGTIVHESAEIIGPTIIGNNCHIGHASMLRGSCIIGNDVHVGHASEIKHSIMLNKSVAAHLNYIGDSIVGNAVNIAGGTMVANFRLDKKPVHIWDRAEKIDTGLEKFGSLLGDGVNIGANCVLNPGTILYKNTCVYPLMQVKGVHKEGEVIR